MLGLAPSPICILSNIQMTGCCCSRSGGSPSPNPLKCPLRDSYNCTPISQVSPAVTPGQNKVERQEALRSSQYRLLKVRNKVERRMMRVVFGSSVLGSSLPPGLNPLLFWGFINFFVYSCWSTVQFLKLSRS